MNSGSNQTDEYTNVVFGYFDLTYYDCFHLKAGGKFYAYLTKWLHLIYTEMRQITHEWPHAKTWYAPVYSVFNTTA